jgi:precorrin-6Y C5,15-methyltransferase (decarboxylating)
MSKKVYLVGTGPGDPRLLTGRAAELIRDCACVIAAGARLAQQVKLMRQDVKICALFQIEETILSCEAQETAVLVSGDTGFFSLAETLQKKLDGIIEVETVNGISSLQYLCAKTGTGYEHIEIVSLHGRDGCFLGQVSYNPVVFILTGGEIKAQHVCRELVQSGLESVKVTAGEKLSLPEEKIVTGSAEELARLEFDDLTVLLVENPCFADCREPLKDCDFLRGSVPMTKEEIRWLSVAKLAIHPQDIVYDIGAGTGSVSIEMARHANAGMVYAVEKEDNALALIADNRKRLGAFNLKIIKGEAPFCIEELPAPDKVFIGGSGGRLREILERLILVNPKVRVIVNAISLETLNEAVEAMNLLGMCPEIVNVGVSRAKKAGSHHLMIAQNPVFIITGEITPKSDDSNTNLTLIQL